MKELLLALESEDVEKRLLALNGLEQLIASANRDVVIKALKPHILDWDETVRIKVAHVLKLYTGR